MPIKQIGTSLSASFRDESAEDSFYANQLGRGRKHLGISAWHHSDIMRLLERASTKTLMGKPHKILSFGVAIPDIAFELTRN